MDTRYNKEEYKDELITFYSEPSTPNPPNPVQLIDSDDKTETKEIFLEESYKSKIYHNHPNFQMIHQIFKEERQALYASINSFNISKIPYSSINRLFIAKLAWSEMIQRMDKDTAKQSTPQFNNTTSTKTKSNLHNKMPFKYAVTLPPHIFPASYHT